MVRLERGWEEKGRAERPGGLQPPGLLSPTRRTQGRFFRDDSLWPFGQVGYLPAAFILPLDRRFLSRSFASSTPNP
jgi:hypothetical protein